MHLLSSSRAKGAAMESAATLAIAAAIVLFASLASGQTMTITEVDHVGNRITVSGPGVEKRIVDLDDAAISGADASRLRVSDLQSGDQVLIDGTLSGTRLSARSVQVVPPPSPGATVPSTDTRGTTPERDPTGPRSPSSVGPGAPIPPPSPGGMGQP
jgi:hypothetical protein